MSSFVTIPQAHRIFALKISREVAQETGDYKKWEITTMHVNSKFGTNYPTEKVKQRVEAMLVCDRLLLL